MIHPLKQRWRRLHEYLMEPLYLDLGGLAERRWTRQAAGALLIVLAAWLLAQAQRLPGGRFAYDLVRVGMQADVDLATAWHDLRAGQFWQNPSITEAIARMRGPLASIASLAAPRRRGEPPRDATLVQGGTAPDFAAPVQATVDRTGAAETSGGNVTRVAEVAQVPAPAPFQQWPVERDQARVVARFGWRDSPATRERVFYEGVDLEAAPGARVLAVEPGTVVGTGEHPTFGRWVEIDHGKGLTTFYGYLGSVDVQTGVQVRAGQRIGEVGRTGQAETPRLHFQVRAGGRPIEPEPFLSIAPR